MSKLLSHSVTRFLVVFFAVFMLSGVYTYAQDTPTDVPTDPPTLVPTDVPPTDAPTAAPTDVPTDAPTAVPTDVPTDVPTTEVPTAVATDVPTAAPTDVQPTEPPVVVTEPATPTVAPEPPMTALFTDSFDTASNAWAAASGWSLVPSENGSAWQVTNSNAPLVLQKGNFFNVDVQARFLLQAGSAELIVRQTDAGNYVAAMDASGVVGLYRSGVLLQSAQVTPVASGTWRTLRLAAVDGVLRVSVDGVEVIALADATQVPMGTVAIAGNFAIPTDGSAAPQNTFLVDDFSLSVKSNEIQLYQTPVPTEEVTAVATTEAPTAAPTEVTAAPTTEVPNAAPTIGAEPALSVLLTDAFDSADSTDWGPAAGWALVPSDAGYAWQVTNSNAPLGLQKGNFFNVVTQARFLLQGGSAQLILRQSDAGNYTASLDTSGIVSLSRAGALLQQAQVDPVAAGAWRVLRFSAVDGVLRVSVDGSEVITVADAAPLPPGTIAIGGNFVIPSDGSDAPQNTFLVDDFSLSVKSNEIQLYQTPTPVAATETPVVTQQPAAAPTFVGKDTSAFAKPSPQQLASAQDVDNNNFNAATSISTPFIQSDDTTSATLESGEPQPNCGQNLSNSVWFKFTPSVAATYSLSTAGSNFDTILAVYTSTVANPTFAQLVKFSCNDDASTATFTSALSLPAVANKTYYIQLGGYNGRFGTYTFRLINPSIAAPTVAPLLTGPVDGYATDNNNHRLPNLTWSGVAAATHYEVQIDDSAAFTAPLSQSSANVDSLAYTVSPDLPGTTGTTYYWRVRGLNTNGVAGPFSLVRKFVVDTVAPAAPTLTAPAAGAIVAAPKPAFSWPAVAGANGYFIDVDKVDCNFTASDLILNNAPVAAMVTTVTYTSTVVLPQGTYCWRVTSKDAAGNVNATPSASRSFSVFYGTTPANGAFVANGKPAFSWSAVPGTGSYDLQVATDPDFAVGHMVAGFPKHFGTAPLPTTFTPGTALTAGTYFWRVLSTNLDTDPSKVGYRTFFVGAAPAAPTLIAPTNGQVLGTFAVNLSWNAVTGVPAGVTLLDYQVQVSTDAAFTPANVTTATVSSSGALVYSPAGLAEGVTYYWHVRARYGDPASPVLGAVSQNFSFKIDTTFPAVPTMLTPANNGIITTVKPTFTWTAVAGATSYRLDVVSDPTQSGTCNFSSTLTGFTDRTVTGTSFASTLALQQGFYCWRLRAVDAAGNTSASSTPNSFSIFIGTAPANGAFVSTGKPMFTWTAVPGATSYDVQVATDPDFAVGHLVTGYPKHFGTAPLPTTYTATVALPAGQILYWRVLSSLDLVPANVGFRTLFVATAPAAPQLIAPAAGAALTDATPTFTWNAVPPPSGVTLLGYQIQIANDTAFTVNPQTVSVGNTLTYTPSTALSQGAHSWHVRALFGDSNYPGNGAYSAGRAFTVDTVAPAAPTVTPANGVTVSASKPVFTWPIVPASTGYVVDIAANNTCDFSGALAVANKSVAQAVAPATMVTYTTPVVLKQGLYCMRVKAVDAAGNASGYTTRVFTLFIGTAPVNGAFVPAGKPAFKWTAVPGATSYKLEIATDANFNNPVTGYPKNFTVAPLPTTFTPATALAADTYYWRVSSNIDTTLSQVPSHVFFVGAGPAPLLTAPLNNASIPTTSTTLTWSPVTAPSGVNFVDYQIQLANNVNFTSPLIDDTTTSTSYPSGTLTNGVIYYWRVRGRFGDAGSPALGPFSTPFHFTVDTTNPAVPVLVTPGVNASVPNPIKFTWNPVPGAVRYNLLYGTDSTPDIPVSVPNTVVPPATTVAYTLPSPLPVNTYYWQVQAVDAAGNTSDFSAVRTFKVISVAGAVPLLNRFSSSPITLSWGPISWVNGTGGHYELQIDNVTTFASPEYNNANIASNLQHIDIDAATNHLVVGTWYWRVRACSGAAATTCGAWSTTGTFTIDF